MSILQLKRTDAAGRTLQRIKRMRHVKVWFLIFTILLSFVLIAGSTLAWYTAADTVQNEIDTPKPKNFDVHLVDLFEPPVTPPAPDNEFYKAVGAHNTGGVPAFVRLYVAPVIFGADGVSVLPASIGPESANPASTTPAIIMDDLAASSWVRGPDDYWYYLGRLDPGQQTPNLFSVLRLNPNLGEEYLESNLRIEVIVEAADTANYRYAWWGITAAPTTAGLAAVDALLQTKLPSIP